MHLEIVKNYRGTILPATTAKVFNILLLNHIRPKGGLLRNRSTASHIRTTSEIIEGVCVKKILRQHYCSQISLKHSIPYTEVKVDQRQSVYVSKETVTSIMMLYKNMIERVRSPDGNSNGFDTVDRVFYEDIFELYIFIICLDYIQQTS